MSIYELEIMDIVTNNFRDALSDRVRGDVTIRLIDDDTIGINIECGGVDAFWEVGNIWWFVQRGSWKRIIDRIMVQYDQVIRSYFYK